MPWDLCCAVGAVVAPEPCIFLFDGGTVVTYALLANLTVLSLLVLLPTVEGLLPVAVEAVVVPVLPVAVPVVLPVLAVDEVVFVAA